MTGLPLRETLRDAAVLAAAGVVLGLAANALSPRGIVLRRDYFAAAAPVPTPGAAAPATATLDAARRARLAQRGIELIDHARAAGLFRDPARMAGRIVFVDARDDAHYQAGHIPGAHQLDHYRLERFIAEIIVACAVAERVVVYCNGGECEDSELAAADLLQLGVPATKIAVYPGGLAEWRTHGLPLEAGARGSGRAAP